MFSPITLGTSWRLAATLFFWVLIGFGIAMTPVMTGKIVTSLLSLPVLVGSIKLLVRAMKASDKETFAIASVIGNATFTLMVASILITDPSLHQRGFLNPSLITLGSYVLVLGYAYMTWRRWRQLKLGTYLQRFEKKPKLPSPFEVLKRPAR